MSGVQANAAVPLLEGFSSAFHDRTDRVPHVPLLKAAGALLARLATVWAQCDD